MNVGVGKPGSTDHRENIQVLARSCPWLLLFANRKPEFQAFPHICTWKFAQFFGCCILFFGGCLRGFWDI